MKNPARITGLLLFPFLLLFLLSCSKPIYGTFESDNLGKKSTVTFDGTKAVFKIAGGVVTETYDCERADVESVDTGKRYEGIEFKNPRSGRTFYAKILEENPSGEIRSIYISLPGFGRYHRTD